MKILSIFSLSIITTASLFSQGIPVSHTPEKKNVVLEEYTGFHCPNCPNGHKYAKIIADAHPGDVVQLRYHAGGYAVPDVGEPDLRTNEGESLANQAGVDGYPSASINRHVFPAYADPPGGTPIVNRQYWVYAADQILTEDAYANLGVEASIDVQTNVLTVHVQVYYTSNAPSSTNRLHVALLQDSIQAPQTNANQNPDMILPNGNYLHMHVLRKMLSGVTGRSISTGVGTTVNEYFTYAIPDSVRDIPIVLSHLKVAAFVSQSLTEVITGHEISPTYSNFPGANSSKLLSAAVKNNTVCGFTASPVVTIQNYGSQPLNSLTIDYSVNGSPVKTTGWTGSLTNMEKATVELPEINFFPSATNALTVSTQLPNGSADPFPSDDEVIANFNQAPDVINSVTMTLQLDYYGSEVRWEVVNSAGITLYSGGPYTNVSNPTSGPPLPAPITAAFSLTSGDCYTFVTHDSYGDGILGTGTGFTLKDASNYVIVSNYSKYASGGEVLFGVDVPQPDSSDVFPSVNGIAETALGYISVFPNPASGKINIAFSSAKAENATVQINNILGETILELLRPISESKTIQLETAGLASGVYFLSIRSGERKYTQKILISN